MTTILCVSLAALLLDQLLGEPRRWHPLVGFGRYAQWLENHCNRRRRIGGVLAWLLAVGVPVLALIFLRAMLAPWLALALDVLVLYAAIGRQSLMQHARAVFDALYANDLPEARRTVGMIVSRDTRALDARGVSKAAVETVLENGSDAIFASLFWYAVAGAPGVLLHRLANTLDAMWGYRNERFDAFGWAAARIDDVLNFVPARLTALAYAIGGYAAQALRCWRAQAPAWSSPNAGPVMAAGAGALRVQLGGAAIYHGVEEVRPPLGCDHAVEPADITRALRLLDRAVLIWLGTLAGAALVIAWLR